MVCMAHLAVKVRELPAEDILENLQEAAEYVQGLWDRLNGGGFSKTGMQLPIELPMPLSTKEQCMTVMSHLSLEVRMSMELVSGGKPKEESMQFVNTNNITLHSLSHV